jgi:hypothetical protein
MSEHLYKSELAERAAGALQSAEYHADLKRHTKLAVAALLVGLCGSVVSIWLLLSPAASSQAAQFWLLCLILSAGVFSVAALTLVGSLSAHLSMQRLALGNKDAELFEITREVEELLSEINALASLVGEVGAKREMVDYRLVEYSLRCIARPPTEQKAADHSQKMRSLLDRWRALGASPENLESFALTTSSGVVR